MAFNQTLPKRATRMPSYEGGEAYSLGTFDELYLLVATSLYLGDRTFYESGSERLERFQRLANEVIHKDPEGYKALTAYARNVLNLRSSPAAMLGELFLGSHKATDVARHVWLRGDEHLETMAYVDAHKLKSYPKQFKAALAERLNAMSERQFIKYAAKNRNKSQYDALNVARPVPVSEARAALFRWVVGGYGGLKDGDLELLPDIARHRESQDTTWESTISAHGSSAETWERSIPKMGYMALLRNLRNFIEKGVSEGALREVAAKLSLKHEVERSQQFPYRFLSAYNALPQSTPLFLREAVSAALNHSVGNVPTFTGRTLVLVDLSASMVGTTVSGDSSVLRTDIAAMFGAIFALANDADVWLFGTDHEQLRVIPNSPVLAVVDAINRSSVLNGGTYTGAALATAFRLGGRYERLIVLTDGQAHDNPYGVIGDYRRTHPDLRAYEINLAAYPQVSIANGGKNVAIGGFSDSVFKLMGALETERPRDHIIRWYAGKNL